MISALCQRDSCVIVASKEGAFDFEGADVEFQPQAASVLAACSVVTDGVIDGLLRLLISWSWASKDPLPGT